MVWASEPKPLADIAFTDADGRERRLSEWRGKTVLVNLWATWCAPCKREMPSLDRLQAKLGSNEFAVLPISLDRGVRTNRASSSPRTISPVWGSISTRRTI
ncbi:MAG: TlpA family protein disulfide reductase [Rhodomicrobium sp.]|nr:TlpA family protein disulfide reductase [Rhodomicrobium sp.]